jgi:hypothetical protein
MNTDTPAEQTSFEAKVNTIVADMVQKEDGKWSLPEGLELDEPTRFAVTAERRRRDTQSEYSKSQARLRQVEAENIGLATVLEKELSTILTAEQRTELDELKALDPDAWRVKLNEYEQANQSAAVDKTKSIKEKAVKETELQRRERIFKEFQAENADLQLTEEVIENDLPPRFIKRLEKGEITFEQFLDDAKKYLTKGKVVKEGETPPTIADLSSVGGGTTPAKAATDAAGVASYSKEVY